jgi:hypothetical protein
MLLQGKSHSTANNHVIYFIRMFSITVIFDDTLDPQILAVTGFSLFF